MNLKLLTVLLLLGTVLSACAPVTTPAPTATATAKVVPTATSAPTITQTPVTYLPGLSANVPEPEAAFIHQVVNEHYLSVMGLSRDQVILTYREHTDVDGLPYVVMLDDATGVPLGVFTGGMWQRSTLKFFGEQVGLVIGNSGFPSDRLDTLDENAKIALMDSARMTVGSGWNVDEPKQGEVEQFSLRYYANDMVQYAETELGIHDFIFHPLIYASAGNVPLWLENGNFTRDELREIMQSRIEYVLTHTPEASAYIVVNEPYLPANLDSADPFYRMWGDYGYITEAFQITRDVADSLGRTDVKLVFNNNDNNTPYGANSQITRGIVETLHEAGLIDYVGMQMHVNYWSGVPDGQVESESILEEIKFYTDLGVPVYMTEMTYGATQPNELAMSPAEFDDQLARIFVDLFRVALDSGNVDGITYWGPSDPFDLESMHSLGWFHFFYDDNRPRKAYYATTAFLYERAISQ